VLLYLQCHVTVSHDQVTYGGVWQLTTVYLPIELAFQLYVVITMIHLPAVSYNHNATSSMYTCFMHTKIVVRRIEFLSENPLFKTMCYVPIEAAGVFQESVTI